MALSSVKIRLATIGPGILVAATGVGAGDLATATLAGERLGTTILWAVVVGAALKFVLNEGLTRWQLATGTTLLEGAVKYLGRPMQLVFLCYLLIWSFLVAMALMSACGVAAHALCPFFSEPAHGKLFWGILQSLIAATLVLLGGYRLFERIMAICIGIMFVVCTATAIALRPSVAATAKGLLIPSIPDLGDGGVAWTIALLGGVGGTVTVLCYGYWIREEGRHGIEELSTCRIDLAVGYLMTAVFGLSMVMIGSRLPALSTTGASLVVDIADVLQSELGRAGAFGKWAFLIGAWGAFFSSLLGVWQSVPYIFCDFWRLALSHDAAEPKTIPANVINTSSGLYRLHLCLIATLPISGLFLLNFSTAMKINGIVGAVFIPMLALALLLLNGNSQRVGAHTNSRSTTVLLVAALATSIAAAGFTLWRLLEG